MLKSSIIENIIKNHFLQKWLGLHLLLLVVIRCNGKYLVDTYPFIFFKLLLLYHKYYNSCNTKSGYFQI